MAWKLVNVLWGLLAIIGGAVVRHVFNKQEELEREVDAMKLSAVQNHVTKADMKEAFNDLIRHHIAPLNRDIGALIRALRAQEIHVDRPDRG
jgi:hypothetical protein